MAVSNLLDSIKDQASSEIGNIVAQFSVPNIPDISDGIDSEIKPDELWDKYAPENQGKENPFKLAADNAKDSANKAINDVGKQAQDMLENTKNEYKEKISQLGQDLGLLVTETPTIAIKTAGVPPAIIGVAPLGPSVSPNLIPSLFSQVKSDFNRVATLIGNCKSSYNALGIDKILAMASMLTRNRSYSDKRSMMLGLPPISTVSIDALTKMVGGFIGGSESMASEPDQPSSPTPVKDYEASDCKKFSPVFIDFVNPENTEVSYKNCINKQGMDEDGNKFNNDLEWQKGLDITKTEISTDPETPGEIIETIVHIDFTSICTKCNQCFLFDQKSE